MGILDSFKRYRAAKRAKQAQERAIREERTRQEREDHARQIEVKHQALIVAARAWFITLPSVVVESTQGIEEAILLDLYDSWQALGMSSGGGLLPRKGETILGHAVNVARLAWRTQRPRTGGYGGTGVSIKITKGLWIHPHYSAPVAYESVRNLQRCDLGQLYLTDTRVYYGGGEHNVDMRFAKMDTIPTWTQEGILIIANGMKEEIFLVGDGHQAQSWVRLIGLFQVVARRDAA